MFYGVEAWQRRIWLMAKASNKPYFYCDNSYFDDTRGKYFRVTRNALQHSGEGASDGRCFKALNIEIKPWSVGGHLVICPQSDYFMRGVVGYPGDWTADVVAKLQTLTDRKIRIRSWSRNKERQLVSLQEDLKGAHAVVTWSSAAAVTAILAGVPAVSMGQSAACLMSTPIEEIENPRKPDGREEWAGVLASAQWTLDEMASGQCWRELNA